MYVKFIAVALSMSVAPPPTVFRVFHTDKLTPRVRELHERSANLSGIPLSRHKLVVFNTPFADESLRRCNATHMHRSLLAPAYQADLMRYCLLYLYGGIYLDLMTTLTQPSSHLFTHDLATVHDILPQHMWNAVIAGRQGHPAFLLAIKMIRQNILYCRKTPSDLSVTGPRLWYYASIKHNPVVLGKLEGCPDDYEGCAKVPGLLLNKMPGYASEFASMGYTPQKKYGAMWSRGIIYAPNSCKIIEFSDMFWL